MSNENGRDSGKPLTSSSFEKMIREGEAMDEEKLKMKRVREGFFLLFVESLREADGVSFSLMGLFLQIGNNLFPDDYIDPTFNLSWEDLKAEARFNSGAYSFNLPKDF